MKPASSRWVSKLFKTASRIPATRSAPRLRCEMLEDRLTPSITILNQGSIGTLDATLLANNGTITAAQSSGNQSISAGALATVGALDNLNITSQDGITVNHLDLPVAIAGHSASFNALNNSITFADPTNTVSATGALNFTANGTNGGLTLGALNGSTVSATTDGNLSLGGATATSGTLTLNAGDLLSVKASNLLAPSGGVSIKAPVLDLDLTGTTTPTLNVSASGSVLSIGGSTSVTVSGGGTVNATGGTLGTSLDLASLGFQDGNPNPDLVNISTTTGGMLNVTVQSDGTGAPVSIFSGLASGVSSFTLNGSSDRESVLVDETNGGLPPITVNGNGPTTVPGDMLSVNETNATGATVTPGATGAGTVTFSNRATITYTGIESVATAVVTVAATDPNAAERGINEAADPGLFTLTRTGPLTDPLTVNYTLGGTAVNGKDYQALSGSVTFAAGSATATITVNALNNSLVDGTRTVVVTLAPGTTYYAAPNTAATVSIASNDFPSRRLATAQAVGGVVQVYDAGSSTPTASFSPYGSYPVGVAVAVGDVNGDGVPDIVTVVSSGAMALVKVYDGKTFAVDLSFLAFPAAYTGGASIALADLDGSGRDSIVIGSLTGISVVAVFNGITGAMQSEFLAYGNAPVGVNVAAGDVNGDGVDEIITAPTAIAPLIRVFNAGGTILNQFFAFPPSIAGVGVTVTVADLDGDGREEIVVGATVNGANYILTYNNDSTLKYLIALPASSQTGSNRSGLPITSTDVNGDGIDDLIVSVGSLVGEFDGPTGHLSGIRVPYSGYSGAVSIG